jgi:glycosyltransferase involved in cell wall biosynthesis
MIDITVVITCYNRCEQLCFALTSFSIQTYPMDQFEIIVVDDGSTDGTVSDLESQSWPFPLKVIRNETNFGISHARNIGIENAEGTIVVFSDSDMIVPPHYLEQHWKAHQGAEKRVVCAPFRRNIFTIIYADHLETKLWANMLDASPQLGTKIPENFSLNDDSMCIFAPEDILNGSIDRISPSKENKSMSQFISRFGQDLKDCPMPWLAYAGSNSSVTRESLIEIGGFDDQLRYRHDDRDIGYRLYLTGHHFFLHPEIISIHQDHFREKDRDKMDYLSMYDLAIMLNKHPDRDMYLFGLYQSNKSRFKPIFIAKLKEQMALIEHHSDLGKRYIFHLEKLLKYHVLTTISSYVRNSPLDHPKNHLYLNISSYYQWVATLKKKKRCKAYPEFVETVDYLMRSASSIKYAPNSHNLVDYIR